MDIFEIVDGNYLFDLAINSKVSDAGKEADQMIRSFIRSALDPGLIDPNFDSKETEHVIALMNLINSIRWFVEANKGVS